MTRIVFFFVFSFLAITIGYPTTSQNENLRNFHLHSEECRREVGATNDDVHRLLNGSTPSTMTGRCLQACLMKRYNVMDYNGKLVSSVALEEASRLTNGDMEKMQLAIALIGACSDIRISENACEAAAEYDYCFRKEAKAMGLPEY